MMHRKHSEHPTVSGNPEIVMKGHAIQQTVQVKGSELERGG